jgi:Cof subfamily protein (haloacid dehalogenase superfamily)
METEARGIRLIVIDLDGTLLTSKRTLAPEGARLLKEAAQDGKHVVLATTRNPDSVHPFCRALEINEPIICTNGAQVWGSPDGPVWAYHSIPREAALEIARLADTHNWELGTTVGGMTYWRQRPGQALGSVAANITVVASNSDAMMDEPVRILTWHPDAVDGVRLLCQSKLASQCYAEIYYRPDGTVHSLGVFALQANKGTALDLVLNRLGLKPHQVMAIGDNLNDLPMFTCARISVAMSNAPDEVKQKATVVAPSNDEEGVAWALRVYGVV